MVEKGSACIFDNIESSENTEKIPEKDNILRSRRENDQYCSNSTTHNQRFDAVNDKEIFQPERVVDAECHPQVDLAQ